MKATFPTVEILALMELKVPRDDHPQFRLQNFLLGKEDWQTSGAYSLHIGEQRELAVLRKVLGRRDKIIFRIREEHSERMWLKKNNRGFMFPTKADYKAFENKVIKAIGTKITLTV